MISDWKWVKVLSKLKDPTFEFEGFYVSLGSSSPCHNSWLNFVGQTDIQREIGTCDPNESRAVQAA